MLMVTRFISEVTKHKELPPIKLRLTLPIKVLGLTFSSKLDWALTSSLLLKLLCSMRFLSPEVALYLSL